VQPADPPAVAPDGAEEPEPLAEPEPEPEPEAETEPQVEAAPQRRFSTLLEWAVAFVPPATVLTGLGVWYGYELALARGRYFGLDTTVIDFSTREYVVRAVVAVLGPMLILLVVAGALLWWHVAVRWALRRRDAAGRWRVAVRAVGAALVVGGVLSLVTGLRAVASAQVLPDQQVLRTLLVGAGVLGVTYGAWMVRQGSVGATSSEARGPGAHGPLSSGPAELWHQAGYLVTLGALLVSVFWAFSVAAEERGAADSARLHREGFVRLPGVVVYSTEPLALEGDGVTEDEVSRGGSAFRWRYDGLRLLVRSNQRYFMVPVGWQPGRSTVVVLDEGPGLRFEFETAEGLR
jgi:hypothetical protein